MKYHCLQHIPHWMMEHIHAATSVRDALYQISKKSKVHIHAASVAAAKQVLPLLC